MKNTLYKPDIRERTINYGISYPNDEELIMLILGSGNQNLPVEKMAEKIFDVLNKSNEDDRVKKLLSLKGVGQGKALAIAAALELGRRRYSYLKAQVVKPQDIIPFVKNYAMSNKEHFLMITLNGGHEIIQIHLVTVGTSTRTIVHSREVFKEAIQENASSIIVCHNHPSGNCFPSADDISTTRNLLEASKIIGIPVLDHIIFSCEDYYSFLENGIVIGEEEDEMDRKVSSDS